MALNLAECDRMIAACERAGVMLGYAEELCFAPKYVRLKQLIDEGALGKVHLVKQSEKHDGPHASWFYDTRRSGGGVTFDMGCHAIEFFRWLLGDASHGGKARITSVYAQMGTYVHGDKTDGDDEAILLLTFEGGAVGLAEESWTKPGGMDDRAEVFGSEGQAYADVLYGNALRALLAARLRLRRREGRGHGGLVVPDLRGDLELRLPSGDGALRRLRPRRDRRPRERPGRPRRRRGRPCPLRLGRPGPARRASVRQRRGPADRSLEAEPLRPAAA